MTRREKIEALARRRDHLAARVKNQPTFTFDRAEMSALTWAIKLMEAAMTERT